MGKGLKKEGETREFFIELIMTLVAKTEGLTHFYKNEPLYGISKNFTVDQTSEKDDVYLLNRDYYFSSYLCDEVTCFILSIHLYEMKIEGQWDFKIKTQPIEDSNDLGKPFHRHVRTHGSLIVNHFSCSTETEMGSILSSLQSLLDAQESALFWLTDVLS